jgi:hypothetical protein
MTASRVVAHPGRIVGREVYMRVGEYTLRFWSPEQDVEFFVHASHESFLVSDATEVDCDVSWEIGGVRLSDTPVLRTGLDRWEVRRTTSGWEEHGFFGVGHVPEVCLRLSPDMRQATIVRAPREPGDSLIFASEHPWSELLISRLLSRDGGVLLHSSTALIEGGAVLFIGHSGAGKSTIAEIAEQNGTVILSDDRTIVVQRDGGPVAWGTPWHGSFPRTAATSAPVRGLFLLKQAPVDRIDSIPPDRALKELFVRLIQPRIAGPEVSRTLDTLSALVAACPLRTLHFRPTPAVMDLVRLVVTDSHETSR